MNKFISTVATVIVALSGASALGAGGETKPLKHPHWHHEGIFGKYDQNQLQRGYQVYREVCAACHSMELVAFRHLGEKGGPYHLEKCPKDVGLPASTNCSDPVQNPIIKSLASDFQIEDGPDDGGDMFMRPGLPSDYLPSPYANKQQAQAANGGAYPPDMSLLAKARHHGPQYIYSLLTGYPDELPVALDVPAAQYYNPYYPGDTSSVIADAYLDEEGHILKDKIKQDVDPAYLTGKGYIYGGLFKMANPLSDGIVTYEDGSAETVEQYALDVTAFLTWASEPKMNQRKAMGHFVILYLLIFAGIVYASYKQIWRNVH